MILRPLCLVFFAALLPIPMTYAQADRTLRHQNIRKKLAERSDLKFPYFAPSVHIRYAHPEGSERVLAYYNEIQVKESVRHTYFCTIGFDVGYFGIQDHGSGPLAIFSVWDRGGGNDDPNSVDQSDQTEVLFTNPTAKSSRFGGEGSGAKTMMPFVWEVGKTYRFIVLLTPQKSGTIYSAWIGQRGKRWQKLASYRTVMTKKQLRGFYSFVEDYARNGDTGQKPRFAIYPDHAVMSESGKWLRVKEYQGTIADDVIQNGHSGVLRNMPFSKSGAGTADYQTMPKRFERRIDQEEFSTDEFPAEVSNRN